MLKKDLKTCLKMLDKTRDVPGDIIELGVGCGFTSFALGEWVQDNGFKKKVYSCDTFSGFPYTDEGTPVKSNIKSNIYTYKSSKQFWKDAKSQALGYIIVPVVGRFEDTLLQQLGKKTFSFAWVDADLYRSTLTAINFLKPRMSAGGIIGFHDYGRSAFPGVKLAVDENMNKGSFKELIKVRSNIYYVATSQGV